MNDVMRDCTICGHPEAMHHPTRTETWCIVGIADTVHCNCPGYNPNSAGRINAWLASVTGHADPEVDAS